MVYFITNKQSVQTLKVKYRSLIFEQEEEKEFTLMINIEFY
jgi:hypothetical protein